MFYNQSHGRLCKIVSHDYLKIIFLINIPLKISSQNFSKNFRIFDCIETGHVNVFITGRVMTIKRSWKPRHVNFLAFNFKRYIVNYIFVHVWLWTIIQKKQAVSFIWSYVFFYDRNLRILSILLLIYIILRLVFILKKLA